MCIRDRKNRIKEEILLHCYEVLAELNPAWYLKDVTQGGRSVGSGGNQDARRYKGSYFRIVSMGAVGAAITSTNNQVWTVEKCEPYLESIRSLAPIGRGKTLHRFLDHQTEDWIGENGNSGYAQRVTDSARAHVWFNSATTSPPEYGADLSTLVPSWNGTNGTLRVDVDTALDFSQLVGRRGR